LGQTPQRRGSDFRNRTMYCTMLQAKFLKEESSANDGE
jgi:hypothetical protein